MCNKQQLQLVTATLTAKYTQPHTHTHICAHTQKANLVDA